MTEKTRANNSVGQLWSLVAPKTVKPCQPQSLYLVLWP